PGGEVRFHFLGGRRDGARVRDALARLVERGRLGNVSLVPTQLAFRQEPTLLLQSVRVNHERGVVREDDEFILACVAQGSARTTFRWYKDGAPVNHSRALRRVWTQLLPADAQDQYTALLGVERAHPLDEGRYTCQVTDWGVQQCRSLRLQVLTRPQVRLLPMSATLERGDDVNIKCMSPNDQRLEKFGFNWTKNKALFRMRPGSEFRSLTLGFEMTTGSATLHALQIYLYRLVTHGQILPGEGEMVVELLAEIQNYLNMSSASDEILNSTHTFFHIMSLLLGSQYSLINQ
ncbi:Uncharacterized protein GBIM_16809, partial [Gryllus bimaculatus]